MTITYKTVRLSVAELTDELDDSALSTILADCLDLLTPSVVQHLPADFQDINSIEEAQKWLVKLRSESQLLLIKQADKNCTIGFLFIHSDQTKQAHIGYLLGEEFWGQGFATEVLQGLLAFAAQHTDWTHIIGGVTKDNTASAKLLSKLGFIPSSSRDQHMTYYSYSL